MQIVQFVFNAFQEQCYLLFDAATRHALIIDPGMSTPRECAQVSDVISREGLTLQYILLTHSHVDHVLGTGYLHRQYPDAIIAGSADDQRFLPTAQQQAQLFGMGVQADVAPITLDLHEGDLLRLGPADAPQAPEIRVVDCPGHSYHGLCYYLPATADLFSGDVLFRMSVGRSDFGPDMGCDGRMLRTAIVTKLLGLPSGVRVYPGHGPCTTIGDESACNPYL